MGDVDVDVERVVGRVKDDSRECSCVSGYEAYREEKVWDDNVSSHPLLTDPCVLGTRTARCILDSVSSLFVNGQISDAWKTGKM
jgi:hypothetical protein